MGLFHSFYVRIVFSLFLAAGLFHSFDMFSTVLSRFLAVGLFHSFYIYSSCCFSVSSCSWTISLILHIPLLFFSLFLQLDYFTHFTYSAFFFSLFLQLDYFTHFTYSAVFLFVRFLVSSCSLTISPTLHIQQLLSLSLAVGLFHPFYIFSTMLSLFLAAQHATPRQLGLVLRRLCGPP